MPRNRAAETQSIQTFEHTLTRKVAYKYLLGLPEGYDTEREKRWPLLLFLHGSGERGDDGWLVAKHGPPKLLRAAAADDPATQQLARHFIVVSPQCPKNHSWHGDGLVALLDRLLATHRVDRARVYLTGLSLGGFGAWDLAMRHPERFAAVAPICGGGDFIAAYFAHQTKRADLRRLAVWAFHGARDPVVPPSESERMVNLLKRFEVAEAVLTVYPEATHDSWTATYANPELYAWFLRHARPTEPGKD